MKMTMKRKSSKKLIRVVISLLTILGLFLPYTPFAQAQLVCPLKYPPDPLSAGYGKDVKIILRVPVKSATIRQKADTALVMDITGSMTGSWGSGTKYDAAKAALKAFASQTQWDDPPGPPVEEWDKVGLVDYTKGCCRNSGYGGGLFKDVTNIGGNIESNVTGQAGRLTQAASMANDVHVDALSNNLLAAQSDASDLVRNIDSILRVIDKDTNDANTYIPNLVQPVLNAEQTAQNSSNNLASIIPIGTVGQIDAAAQTAYSDISDAYTAFRSLDGIFPLDEEEISYFLPYIKCESCPTVASIFNGLPLKDFFLSGMLAMDSAGQSEMNTFIDGIPKPPVFSSTPIGAGLEAANRQLIWYARSGVQKYVVLATDGLQNAEPSIYDPIDARGAVNTARGGATPLQKAIDNNIRVITVAIGSDVQARLGGGCPNCPANVNTGEEYLKDLACKTDPDCKTGNANNNPTNPRNYFFAPDDSDLDALYQLIQQQIASDFTTVMFDNLNSNIFEIVGGAVDIKHWDITRVDPLKQQASDCDVANVPPADILSSSFTAYPDDTGADPTKDYTLILNHTDSGHSGVWANFGKITDGKDRCIILTVRVVSGAPCDLQYVDAGDGYVGYIDPDGGTQEIAPFNNPQLDIKCAEPWIKTTVGDVGANGPIGPMATAPPSGEVNADYLALAIGRVDAATFKSAKNWLVGGYLAFSTGSFEASPDIYSALYDKYTTKGFKVMTSWSPLIALVQIKNAANAASNPNHIVYYHPPTGTALIRSFVHYNGPPAVVFIDGNLSILPGFYKGLLIDGNGTDSGLVFVVNGNINIDPGVKEIDGIYVSKGLFKSGSFSAVPPDEQLVVNGAVLAYSGLNLERSLNNANKTTPSEVFNYDPGYLWIFRDILGSSTAGFRELAP